MPAPPQEYRASVPRCAPRTLRAASTPAHDRMGSQSRVAPRVHCCVCGIHRVVLLEVAPDFMYGYRLVANLCKTVIFYFIAATAQPLDGETIRARNLQAPASGRRLPASTRSQICSALPTACSSNALAANRGAEHCGQGLCVEPKIPTAAGRKKLSHGHLVEYIEHGHLAQSST